MTTNEPQDFQLPEYSGNPFIANLPPILSMAAAVKALNAPPAFHERRGGPVHLDSLAAELSYSPVNGHAASALMVTMSGACSGHGDGAV